MPRASEARRGARSLATARDFACGLPLACRRQAALTPAKRLKFESPPRLQFRRRRNCPEQAKRVEGLVCADCGFPSTLPPSAGFAQGERGAFTNPPPRLQASFGLESGAAGLSGPRLHPDFSRSDLSKGMTVCLP